DPPPRPLLTGAARATAQQAHLRRGSWFDADVMHGNPMALLLDYLAHPVAKDWEDLALSACAGAAKAGGVTPIDSAQLLSVLTSAVEGAEPPAGRADTAVAHLATFATAAGLRLVLVLDAQDPNAERWTV